MIGLGGYDADGTIAASNINVTSETGTVSVLGGGTDSFAHIGIGGRNTLGAKTATAINVTANGADMAGNGISVIAGDNAAAYAQHSRE
jgi:hypothetical protein